MTLLFSRLFSLACETSDLFRSYLIGATMLRQTAFARRRWATLVIITTLWASFPPTPNSLAQSAASAAATPTPTLPAARSYSINPGTLQLGSGQSNFRITAADGSALPAELEVDTTSLGNGITVQSQGLVDSNKVLLVTLASGAVVTPGVITLKLIRKDQPNQPVGFVELSIGMVSRQPTPEGISRVDTMWAVLPYKIVRDAFGRRVANSFYAIEIVIGNNSGFDLQIASVGFNSALGAPGSNASTYSIPTSDSRLVRGVLQRDQQAGVRTLSAGLLTGVGTLMTGFLPFFHALGPRANFSTFSNLLNGSARDGFNLAVPNLLVDQLNRLDDLRMSRDFIVQNNSQRRTLVFLPRRQIALSENERRAWENGADIATLMGRIGTLVLVGREIIPFLHREIVTSIPSPTPTPTVTPSPTTTPTPTAILGGRVTATGGNIVTLNLTTVGGTQTITEQTDAAGNYAFIVPRSGSYIVTPTLDGFVFNPPTRNVNNLNGPRLDVDFAARPAASPSPSPATSPSPPDDPF